MTRPKTRGRAHETRARLAVVLVPEDLEIPDHVTIQDRDLAGDLSDPHDYTALGVHSVRRHPRAHHRIILLPDQVPWKRYIRKRVYIIDAVREYAPFVSHWGAMPPNIRLVNHYAPGRKVDAWANRRMRDWKHGTRNDPATGRADAIARLNYRSELLPHLAPALRAGPAIALDTAAVMAKVD